MKRATITFPDDLAQAVESYMASQEAPPALTTAMQTALRHYLTQRGFLRARRNFGITAARKGSGHSDVSRQHDQYLAGKQK